MQAQITFIEKNRLLSIDTQPDAWIDVLSGKVWLTEEGVASDFVLESGSCHHITHGGRVCLSAADANAIVQLVQPQVLVERGDPRLMFA